MNYINEYARFDKDDWKKSNSEERKVISETSMDILLDLSDDGYVIRDQGWISDTPYIWISNRRRRKPMDINLVNSYIERLVDYLEGLEFHITRHDVNMGNRNAQIYIYFDKK